MTQHSTQTTSVLSSNSPWGRLLKRPWPAQLVLVAALLLAVPFLFHAGSTVHAADNEITGVTLTSPNPGELAIAWDAPSRAPSDYRVTWKKSDGKWPSYKNANTAQGGNAFPTGTSHTVSDLEEGTEYSVRVRARYHDGDGNVQESGPWSDPPVGLTIAGLPDKPTGLSASPSHDSVDLSWTDPGDNSVTSYQVLRGPDADNLAVLADNTGGAATSYTDSTVAAETTYVYAIRARNTHGLGPQSDAVSATTPAAPVLPAKPTGITYGASHKNALMFWTDPDDDSITGYQILRGPDADSLAVLTEDTGSTDASYSDDTVSAETTYVYAIRARNAAGLGPQSDTVSVTTQAAPEELLTELALAGVEFIIAGQTLDTTGTCSEGDITQIAAECTENITNPMPQFGVVGTLDSDDEVSVRIGRTFAVSTVVADESDLQGPNKRINPTFQPGRNILTIWGDEDGSGSTAAEQHFFRINVVPYWEWNGERLSKDSDCRDTTANAPTVDEITDDDCIVAPEFGNTAELRFFNVINDHFNVYVEVNETNVISEPSTTDLGSSFTVNLDAGDNLIRIRLAAKGGQPTGEVYDSDYFYYKVTTTDVLVSNIGQTDRDTGNFINQTTWRAQQFTTGTNPDGYTVSEVVVNFESGVTGAFNFSIHQTDESGTFDVPGTKVVDLTGSPTTTGEHGFTPSNTTTLDPSTKYFVVFSKGTTGATALETTNSDNVDAVSANDWDMADKTLASSDSGSTWDERDYAIEIAVKGALATISDDATLSDLVLTDPDNTVVTLDPTFESGVESYTATVANAVSQIKVEPTRNDDTATIEYLDSTNTVLTDADTNTAVFDVDLAEGENIFKVKVTAEDGTTTKTYVVTVTRDATASDDATLSDLQLFDSTTATASVVSLNPAFDSEVTEYTATVANDKSDADLEVTTNEDDATVEFLDENDATIATAGTSPGNIHFIEPNLAEGENIFKIKVTAEDTTTTKTYTVHVRRTAADDLVSNLGQPDRGVSLIFPPNGVLAMQFTTGTNIWGYTISGVVVDIVSDTSGTFAFAIHETDSTGTFDVPGNKVVDLTGSPTMLGEHTFIPATTTSLDASTEYFIVVAKTSGSPSQIRDTRSQEEDVVAETGWTIDDIVFSTDSGSTWDTSSNIPEFAIKGEPIKQFITLAADFTSIIRELHEVTFTLTRAGSTAQAADVTLMVENATGDSVVSTSGRTETLTFAANDDTVEFAVPIFWIRSGRPTGSFVATVEAGAEYDASAATATVEVVNPTGILIEVKLDKNSYQVTEGNDLTYNVVFNVLDNIAAPNKDVTFASTTTLEGTAKAPGDYIAATQQVEVAAASWTLVLVSNLYVATVPVTLETVDDALYERPMGADESTEIELQGTGGTPSWVLHIGPTSGTTRYPVTIRDNETLNLSAELSSTGLTAGQNLRIDEDAGEDVTLTVTNSDLASDGNPVTLPPGVKLKITPDIPTNRGATETDDWTISPDEIDLGGTATITIVDDMLEEGPESVTFEVGFDDDAAFQSARATLTINDDEYTGPVLQTAAIDAAELTLEFSNTLDASSRPARSAFEVKVRGAAVSLSSSNPVSISGSTVTLRLGSPVTAGDTVTVSYTAPGANPIKDDAALEAPSFTDEPVTNNTPNAPNPPASR